MVEETAYIGLGSNLGNRLQLLRCASAQLSRQDVTIVATSRLYQTAPMYVTSQSAFLNAALEVRTQRTPSQFLDLLHSIENGLGRRREQRYGPRTVDLDILLWGSDGDRIIDTRRLRVPHPLLHERPFVLGPLCDIAPSLQHPVLGRTLQVLLDRLETPPLELIADQTWRG